MTSGSNWTISRITAEVVGWNANTTSKKNVIVIEENFHRLPFFGESHILWVAVFESPYLAFKSASRLRLEKPREEAFVHALQNYDGEPP